MQGRLRQWGDRLPDGLLDAAWLWLVLRLGLTLIAVLVVIGGTAQAPCPPDSQLTFLPHDGLAFPLLGVWEHWDACWYTKIAAFGYDAGTGSTNMFPLLPTLMAAVAGTNGNLPLAAALVNAVAFVVALTGLHQLVQRDFDRGVAERTVLYVAVFPAAFFFIAPYTESLFLAASVWALAGARMRRWEIALVAGILAALARPLGMLLVLPIAWEAGRMLYERRQSGTFRFARGDLVAGLAVVAPVVAYVCFIAFTMLVVGDSYFDANAHWGRHRLELPWNRFADAFAYAFANASPVQALNVFAWSLFALLTLAGLRLLPVSYWIFVVPQLALMLTQDNRWPLMSTIRYLAVLFPCFVVLAIGGRRRRLHVAWTILSVLLLSYLTVEFLEGTMVG